MITKKKKTKKLLRKKRRTMPINYLGYLSIPILDINFSFNKFLVKKKLRKDNEMNKKSQSLYVLGGPLYAIQYKQTNIHVFFFVESLIFSKHEFNIYEYAI